MSEPLEPQAEAFARAYARSGDAVAAAACAGYGDPAQDGPDLLFDAAVSARVAALAHCVLNSELGGLVRMLVMSAHDSELPMQQRLRAAAMLFARARAGQPHAPRPSRPPAPDPEPERKKAEAVRVYTLEERTASLQAAIRDGLYHPTAHEYATPAERFSERAPEPAPTPRAAPDPDREPARAGRPPAAPAVLPSRGEPGPGSSSTQGAAGSTADPGPRRKDDRPKAPRPPAPPAGAPAAPVPRTVPTWYGPVLTYDPP